MHAPCTSCFWCVLVAGMEFHIQVWCVYYRVLGWFLRFCVDENIFFLNCLCFEWHFQNIIKNMFDKKIKQHQCEEDAFLVSKNSNVRPKKTQIGLKQCISCFTCLLLMLILKQKPKKTFRIVYIKWSDLIFAAEKQKKSKSWCAPQTVLPIYREGASPL